MATIKCNFESVLAQFESVEELNSVVQEINNQLTKAYKERFEAIKPKEKKNKGEVQVSVSSEGEKKETAPTAKSKDKGKKEEKKPKQTDKKKEKKGDKKAENKAEKQRTYEVEQVALTDTKAVKKLGLRFVPYNEKCVLLLGETRPIAQALRGLKKSGVFGNGHLRAVEGFEGGFGWLVNKEHEDYAKVCKSLGLKKAV